MPQDIGIPLREILNHPSLAHAKLIAGAGGLDRIVKYVNVMEVPDILDWVKEGELLLTTVYAMREDITAQSRLIPQLAEKNLAGLAIKPGRYIEKIPEIMVAQAEENNLPLLELPFAASFSDIINPIISEILNKQAMILKRADEVHARLSQVVLEGGDLLEIVNALSELLDDNLVMAATCMENMAVSPSEMSDLVAGYELPMDDPDTCALRPTTRGTAVLKDNREVTYVKTPICAGKNYYGTITVFEINSPISVRDELTVERAATIAALAMVNHLAVTDVERRYYSEFLNELLAAGAADEKKMRQRAKGLGINLANSHMAVVLQLEKPGMMAAEENRLGNTEWEDARQLLLQQMMQSLRVQFGDVAVGYKFDSIVMLLPRGPKGDGASKETVKQIGTYIRKRMQVADPAVRVLIGVGRFGVGLTGLQNSYHEAVQGLQIGRNVWPAEDTYYFDALGVWRLLSNIEDKNELKVFVEETVGPIVAYDRERGTDLLKTLEIYFECRGNHKKVAEKMFTHYNTVMYRLDRIVQIAQIDLNDATDSLNLQIGLKILKMLE